MIDQVISENREKLGNFLALIEHTFSYLIKMALL